MRVSDILFIIAIFTPYSDANRYSANQPTLSESWRPIPWECLLEYERNLELLMLKTSGLVETPISNGTADSQTMLMNLRSSEDKMEKEGVNLESLEDELEGCREESKHDKKNISIAYHEAGHAVMLWLLKDSGLLFHRVTIIPTGFELGRATYQYYRNNGSEYQLRSEMCVSLAGQLAREVILGVTYYGGGAITDIESTIRNVHQLVVKYHYILANSRTRTTRKVLNQYFIHAVYEVREQCRKVIIQHKEDITKVARRLLVQNILYRNDMAKLLGPEDSQPFPSITPNASSTTYSPPPSLDETIKITAKYIKVTVKTKTVNESTAANLTTSTTCPTTPLLTKCCGPVLVPQTTTHCCGNSPLIKVLSEHGGCPPSPSKHHDLLQWVVIRQEDDAVLSDEVRTPTASSQFSMLLLVLQIPLLVFVSILSI